MVLFEDAGGVWKELDMCMIRQLAEQSVAAVFLITGLIKNLINLLTSATKNAIFILEKTE